MRRRADPDTDRSVRVGPEPLELEAALHEPDEAGRADARGDQPGRREPGERRAAAQQGEQREDGEDDPELHGLDADVEDEERREQRPRRRRGRSRAPRRSRARARGRSRRRPRAASTRRRSRPKWPAADGLDVARRATGGARAATGAGPRRPRSRARSTGSTSPAGTATTPSAARMKVTEWASVKVVAARDDLAQAGVTPAMSASRNRMWSIPPSRCSAPRRKNSPYSCEQRLLRRERRVRRRRGRRCRTSGRGRTSRSSSCRARSPRSPGTARCAARAPRRPPRSGSRAPAARTERRCAARS